MLQIWATARLYAISMKKGSLFPLIATGFPLKALFLESLESRKQFIAGAISI